VDYRSAYKLRVTQIKPSKFPTGIPAVTTFSYELSGITAFALVRLVLLREMVMPIGRYIAWVGASLLVLLFVADWYLPKPLPETPGDGINRPVIRIASVQQPPERIIIDTSQPTIVPPPTLFGDAAQSEPSPPPLQSYASAVSPATVAHVDQKKRKITRRQDSKVAAYQPPLASIPAVARGSSATTVPLTRLSFTDIISGRLVRNLFNLK
jgi:hypothetical protein